MLEAKVLKKLKQSKDRWRYWRNEGCKVYSRKIVRIHQNPSTALTHGNVSASDPYPPNNVTVDQYPDEGGSCQSLIFGRALGAVMWHWLTQQTWQDFWIGKCIHNSFKYLTYWDGFAVNTNYPCYLEFSEDFAVTTIVLSYCKYATFTNDNRTNHKMSFGYFVLNV